MTHLTEVEMMEEVYGESENTAGVQRHLAACSACAECFAELQRDLAGLDRMEAPARDARYGERVWAAIADSLPAYARTKRPWWAFGLPANPWMRGLSYAAACALLVSCAFYAGRVWEQRQQRMHEATVKTAPQNPPARQPIVVVVLDEHLDRSERFLVQLKHADVDSDTMASPLRDEARSLLAANRVCRKNVAQSDDPELTTALEHLDNLLAETANAPGGLNAQSIAKLQDEMNTNGRLFEVRVLRARISHRKGTGSDPAKGGDV